MRLALSFLLVSILTVISNAELRLQSIEGRDLFNNQIIKVDSVQKKGLVVTFLSAKCPCSNSHNVELKKLAEQYSDFNFVVVHSNADESKEISVPYFKKAMFPFPVIQDTETVLADQLQAFKTPHSFLFDSQGAILYQGGVSNSKDCSKADRFYLREALDDIQNGKKVRTQEGRTIGCIISRGEKNVL